MANSLKRYLSTVLETAWLKTKEMCRIEDRGQTNPKIELHPRNSWQEIKQESRKERQRRKLRKSQRASINKRRSQRKKGRRKRVTESRPRKRENIVLFKTTWETVNLLLKILSRISSRKMKPPNKWWTFHVMIFAGRFYRKAKNSVE